MAKYSGIGGYLKQLLLFRHVGASSQSSSESSSPSRPIHPAYGALKGTVWIMPGTDLTAPADPDWAQMLDEGEHMENRSN